MPNAKDFPKLRSTNSTARTLKLRERIAQLSPNNLYERWLLDGCPIFILGGHLPGEYGLLESIAQERVVGFGQR
jgi:hypothetical protein